MILLHAARPEYLFLLLLLPVVWLAARRLRTIERGRRITIIVLRTLIVLLLTLALARLEFSRRAKDLTVYFLLDRSESVPLELRESTVDAIGQMAGKKPANDEVGVVVFGADASLETLAVKRVDFGATINSVVDGARTDISSAMRLALSAFPNNRLKRIVLFSDGNENSGSALEMARMARNSGVPVDVYPLSYDQRNDVQIDKLVVPGQTAKDTPFEVRVHLSSQAQTRGRLRVYEDGQLIAEEDVDVAPGKNPPLVLPRRLNDGSFHRYRATIEVPGDARTQNNVAQGFTTLKAEPVVLYVEGDQTSQNYLAGALRLEDIRVRLIAPHEIPTSLEELQAYDSIILSNVHANTMTRDQLQMIERAVHDLGIGLVMIGGEDSFGAGGYQDSPIELALPVSMDVKQKKVLPNGALVVVLHTCEIPSGNAWAREISAAALDVLSAQDYFGIVYWGSQPGGGGGLGGGWGDYWLWSPALQETGNKRAMRAKIRGVQPNDMPSMVPSIEMAYKELMTVKAQAKHIVVISDGDPTLPSKEMLNAMRDDGITVSGVAIFPHAGQTVENLRQVCYWGGGNFYYPKTALELPRIFVKEASIVRRSLIFEEPFFPKFDSPSETLEGFASFPQLQGYVVTSDKELATVALRTDKDDPLLAHWRYGLGKTVAFTSDAKNKWAATWVDWSEFSKLWSQIIRWSLRETSSSNLQVNTELRDGKGYVTVDAVDVGGNFRNFLEFDATVLGPDLEPHELTVRQVAPGRYEGQFDAPEVGTYMARLSAKDGDRVESVTAGAALSYSPEFAASRSNEEFLAKVARESGGKVAEPQNYFPFAHDMQPMRQPRPLWEALLLAGLLLVPFDIFLRRVYLDWAELFAAARKQLSAVWMLVTFRKPKDVNERDQKMGSLLAAKERATTDRDKRKEEEDARKEFRERLSRQEQQGGGEGQGSVFADPDKAPPGGAVPRRTKQTISPTDGPEKPPAAGGTMGGLLEAKKRAKKKTGN